MASNEGTFVIVGASLAGAKAAEALRQEGFEGRVAWAWPSWCDEVRWVALLDPVAVRCGW